MTKPSNDLQSDLLKSGMFTIIGSTLLNPPNASTVIEDGTLEEFKYSTFEQNPVDVETFLNGEDYLNYDFLGNRNYIRLSFFVFFLPFYQ